MSVAAGAALDLGAIRRPARGERLPRRYNAEPVFNSPFGLGPFGSTFDVSSAPRMRWTEALPTWIGALTGLAAFLVSLVKPEQSALLRLISGTFVLFVVGIAGRAAWGRTRAWRQRRALHVRTLRALPPLRELVSLMHAELGREHRNDALIDLILDLPNRMGESPPDGPSRRADALRRREVFQEFAAFARCLPDPQEVHQGNYRLVAHLVDHCARRFVEALPYFLEACNDPKVSRELNIIAGRANEFRQTYSRLAGSFKEQVPEGAWVEPFSSRSHVAAPLPRVG